ncbi:MAG TPA: Txe/YoeB family addiction module toxin [Gammaproteobacteria bacterium]|nr:Txe/YoeB family addiction module toxin [Gammaproteobacteria bacterium]
MQVIYTAKAKEDRAYWEKYNPKIVKRIDQLLVDIKKHPFSGIGKPELLKFEKSGYWSRRINHEHRLIYKVVNQYIYIAQCRYHY